MPGGINYHGLWRDAEARRRMGLVTSLAVLALALGIWGGWMFHEGWGAALAREKPRAEDFARWGTCWAAIVNAMLAGAAALMVLGRMMFLLRRGTGAGMPAAKRDGPKPASRNPIVRREWIWLFAGLVLAAGLRWPRMGLSFYNDEAHTFRTYIAGRFKQTDDGTVAWRPVKWSETFWLNKVGNNQAPCSIFGRLSYDAWRKISGASDGAVSETAVRLPQFITGMASLVVLWLAVRRMAGASVANLALFLAALHPWHVRYSTEARAYGFLLLGLSWCLYSLQRAMEDGQCRWWVALGLGEFLCLWSFPGAIYHVFVVDAAILLLLAWRAIRWRGPWRQVLRFCGGLLPGAMLTLQWMLPTIPQLNEAMRQLDSLKGAMGRDWWADAGAGIFFGMRGVDRDPANPYNLALLREVWHWPWTTIPIAGILVFWAIGILRLGRHHAAGGILAISGPVAVGLSWAVMSAQGKFLHPWYVLFAVPGVVISLAAAIEGLEVGLGQARVARFAGALLVLLVAPWWLHADLVFMCHSKEDIRGLADAARRTVGEHGTYAAMLADVDLYDARVVGLKSTADLDGVISQARSSGRPLAVSVGRLGVGESTALYKRLKESTEFEGLGIFRGMEEEQFTQFLFGLRKAKEP